MKAKIAILALLSSAPWVSAESTVPKLMSYQGRVTDSAGIAIGNSAPVNRTVTFRLYSVSSGGTATYNETQTVTISGGEFSVLIGNGTGLTGLPGPTSPASPLKTLDTIINTATTSALYLGITVDDGNSATVDAEISPRQQLVTGAYAMRSLMAETVASGAVTSAMLGDSSVNTNQLASSSITSAKIADASIAAADIAGSAITAAKIDTATVGIWTPSGNNIYRNSNVGIGVINPEAVLQLAAKSGTSTPATNGLRVYNSGSTSADNAVLAAAVASASSGSPFVSLDISGINGWSIGTDNADSDKLVFKNSWDFTANPKMAIDVAGNVGIGTTSPTEKLMISGGSLRVTSTSNPKVVVSNGTKEATLGVATTAGQWSTSSSVNDLILKSESSKVIIQSGAGAAGITIDTSNNISTNNLSANVLTARGSSTTHSQGAFLEWSKNSGEGATYLLNQKGTGGGGIIFGEVTTSNTVTERMRIHSNGFVGINQSNPRAPLHVSGSTSLTVNQQAYLSSGGTGDVNNQSHVDDYSIYCDGRMVASGFDATSDSRIKTDLQVTDNAADLGVLLAIQITDYHHKDSIMHGNRPQKKVIAQQVESVFPQAVTQKGGIIPDIFTGAKTRDGWVMLATDLKVGDKVRLLADKESPVQEVLEVRVGAFRTAFTPKDADVFVYGREVDDLRSVDYDAIAMLNVSATQELAKKLEEKDAVIVALEARLSALEKRVSGAK
ncbi:MAG: tail fiber domain-containing protein [Verrucomicrobia bacterium]|nr:tail fiber domain-containing protein [Verrucomicrobiota bacterium]